VLLIVSLFLLIDIALSEIVPGAYDNASGVATVLSAAEELQRDPPANLDLWVVLTGSEESHCEGMRSFVKARGEMDPARTLIVNVDQTGYGTVHYLVSEGALISYPMDPELVELCEALAASDPRYAAEPARTSLQTDALPALIRGRRAISITGLSDGLPAGTYHTHDDVPENVDAEAMTRASDFVVGLARLIDRGAGRGAASPPPPPAPVEFQPQA
jgi:putative aminopeptidase FrvX